ncbi:hypothetical protein TNCV_4999751 [Trichonephila clavipes]|nr:hypothetical protein TNCV_4999751 [Trichonephila clavipes]
MPHQIKRTTETVSLRKAKISARHWCARCNHKTARKSTPSKGCCSTSKYPGHIGGDGCKQDSSYGPREKSRQERSGERAATFTGPPRPIPSPGYAISNALRTSALKQALRAMLEPHTSLYVGWNTLLELKAPPCGIPDTFRRPGALAKDMADQIIVNNSGPH